MKVYNGQWKLVEGTNLSKTQIRSSLPDCLEKDHLLKISSMLRKEGYMPLDFYVCEYPIEGVYCIEDSARKKYFTISYCEEEKTLTPTYTTIKCDENGCNTFPCKTITESIEKTEC